MVLSELKVGETCRIKRISLSPKIKDKLQCFGMTEGVRITLIRKAPFGGPFEIKVRDFYMSIRKREADNVLVTI